MYANLFSGLVNSKAPESVRKIGNTARIVDSTQEHIDIHVYTQDKVIEPLITLKFKQEAHGPHRSSEKTVQINIITLIKRIYLQ